MKIYLFYPRKDIYIQKTGVLKAKEVKPFLKKAVDMKVTIKSLHRV